jgi:hypothetical protein
MGHRNFAATVMVLDMMGSIAATICRCCLRSILKKESAHMQWLIVVICFFGFFAGMIFVKFQDLGAGLTIAIIAPLVFLVIYSLARIQPKKPEAENDINK